jgi:hypothetical protein
MRDRINTLDRDISDTAREVFGKKNKMSEFAMSGISFFDRLVTVPTWQQAYRVGIELYKGEEAKAVDYADLIVRRSQGSGMLKDLPAIMRGTEFQKLLTMFYSYMSNQLNLVYEQTAQVQSAKDVPRYIGMMMALWILPVTFSEFLAARAPIGDEPDDEKTKFWLSKLLQYPFALFPVVRDIGNITLDAALGVKGFGYRPTPATAAIEAGERLVRTLSKEDSTIQETLESVTKFGSYVVPYPDQFNAWLWNSVDMLNGMEPNLEDVIRRRPKRER